MWILCTFHMSQTICFLLIFFPQYLKKNVKTILSSQAVQIQWWAEFGPWAIVCDPWPRKQLCWHFWLRTRGNTRTALDPQPCYHSSIFTLCCSFLYISVRRCGALVWPSWLYATENSNCLSKKRMHQVLFLQEKLIQGSSVSLHLPSVKICSQDLCDDWSMASRNQEEFLLLQELTQKLRTWLPVFCYGALCPSEPAPCLREQNTTPRQGQPQESSRPRSVACIRFPTKMGVHLPRRGDWVLGGKNQQMSTSHWGHHNVTFRIEMPWTKWVGELRGAGNSPHTPPSERGACLPFGRFSLQVPASPGTGFLGLTNPKLLNALDFIFCAIRWSRLSALSWLRLCFGEAVIWIANVLAQPLTHLLSKSRQCHTL